MALTDLLALLNVAVTLLLIVLALSLFASLAVEAIAGVFATRGRLLRRRILEMLDDPEEAGFARLVLRSPIVAALGERGRFPSYIPKETFALAVVSVMREKGLETLDDLPPALRALALGVGFATEAERADFQSEVAAWYERTMERLSGVYRRSSRRLLFVVGLLLAIALNADMIAMTTSLWQNRAMLGASVARVEAVHAEVRAAAAERGTTPEEALAAADNPELRRRLVAAFEADPALSALDLPLGWALETLDCARRETEADRTACGELALVARIWESDEWSSVSVLGWLLTALALLPGTGFWFDTLGRLLKLRAAGAKPSTPEPDPA